MALRPLTIAGLVAIEEHPRIPAADLQLK